MKNYKQDNFAARDTFILEKVVLDHHRAGHPRLQTTQFHGKSFVEKNVVRNWYTQVTMSVALGGLCALILPVRDIFSRSVESQIRLRAFWVWILHIGEVGLFPEMYDLLIEAVRWISAQNKELWSSTTLFLVVIFNFDHGSVNAQSYQIRTTISCLYKFRNSACKKVNIGEAHLKSNHDRI